MRLPLPCFVLLLLASGLAGCDDAPRFTQAEPGEAQSAGQATVRKFDVNAYSMPSANLSPVRRLDFSVGNSFFRSPWVIAPSTTTARDGLGPLFNTNACQNCHIKDGRGHPPEDDALSAVSMLVRLSLPDGPHYLREIERLGVVPEPVYGTQLQDMAIPGHVPEGKVRVTYQGVPVHFKDGTQVELRQPQLQISQLGYGDLHPDTRFSARVAPPMIGLGLLEAISEQDILANARHQAESGGPIKGRPNQVWDDAQGRTVLGRFGWKAGQPNLNQQNVHAFSGDMGLTTSLRPFDDCTVAQTNCLEAPNGNGPGGEPEVSDNILRLVLFYTRNLGVPARRDVDSAQVLAGKNLFYQAGCQGCHVAQYTTASDAAEPELRSQTIRPYTDLLLHDMGPGLADGRSEFKAGAQDWRTPPLWGIGLSETVSGHSQFLHDGRARNLLEAVLWHGGEAEAARQQVLQFDAGQRAALLAFLNSL
ncbi:di-heme oxidoreductase family protein [Pseudomonas rhizosphaerae]|uniref:di-heme oxidoreductase family protein n=1 Tax=Pseudomonas rhizosphaerae TaxID=216142 RepID=UPI002B489A3E|nr:di-heme oxidoredictase family protein [Pseudomonas rhizosphaerae]MEB2872319.1 di-heme oxidoredictase family protein [Pseudomonas rhizosphaerae]